MKPTKTDPWAKIDALIASEGKPQGEGWLTVRQFASRFGMKPESSQVRRKLNRLVENGLLERAVITAPRLTTYYRPKD